MNKIKSFKDRPGGGIKKKITSRKGETIAEVLIAFLISVLGLSMLAGMIVSSTKIIEKSRKAMEQYYDSEVESTGSGSIKLVKTAPGVPDENIMLTDDWTAGGEQVSYEVRSSVGNNKLYSYEISD